MLMVGCRNIDRGETGIYSLQGRKLADFTLREPCDLAVVNDQQVMHGVTPVHAVAPHASGARDVFVVTFRRKPG